MKNDTFLTHSIGGNTASNARNLSMNSVQGHHHSLFGVERYADTNTLRWSMSVGCLLDPDSPAARYSASNVYKRPILGLGMILGGSQGNTLVISDLHLPYHHKDTFSFLEALNHEYKFTQVLNTGDLFDHHRGSYHEDEPDALDAESEYRQAKKYSHELEQMFPEMVITTGNHDFLPQRKLKTVGLPVSMLSDYNKLYDLRGGWQWPKQYRFNSYGGFPVTHPMVLNKRGRWDKVIMRVKC